MTLQEVEQKIQELQNQLSNGQARLQQLVGYRQALIEMEENKDEKEDEAVE